MAVVSAFRGTTLEPGRRASCASTCPRATGRASRRSSPKHWPGTARGERAVPLNRVPTEGQLARIAAKTRASAKTLDSWRGKSTRELFIQVCGAANLNVRDDGQPEAVPLAHQSTLAGVLMAAELIKRLSPVLKTTHNPPT